MTDSVADRPGSTHDGGDSGDGPGSLLESSRPRPTANFRRQSSICFGGTGYSALIALSPAAGHAGMTIGIDLVQQPRI
jgi:hypothetical protein